MTITNTNGVSAQAVRSMATQPRTKPHTKLDHKYSEAMNNVIIGFEDVAKVGGNTATINEFKAGVSTSMGPLDKKGNISTHEVNAALAKASGDIIEEILKTQDGFDALSHGRAEVLGYHNDGKYGSVDASLLGANAYTYNGKYIKEAGAEAHVAKVDVSTGGVAGTDLLKPNAGAVLIGVGADAKLSPVDTHAFAKATAGEAHAGVKGVPYAEAHASLPTATAGIEVNPVTGTAYAGAGASLLEAEAGGFGVRLGFKVGAGVRNGIPQLDLGPVSAPCSVM